MKIYKASSLKELLEFSQSRGQLGIFERPEPQEAKEFMSQLLLNPLKLEATVYREKAEQDIQELLYSQIPAELRSAAFYKEWVADMAEVCKIFCNTLSDMAIRFRLGSVRGCRRYHTDNVSMRLLVTYQGTGTEWLPDEAANRDAYENGKPNEQIVKDASSVKFMTPWDIAIFRGGDDGVLHRTPDTALNQQSILMRLDPLPYE